jgi:hypothetical protein
MTTTTTNGQQRKTLASQLDRLDGILDTLSLGLNEAVVSAVQEAVTVAVKQAISAMMTEVLTNADLLKQLHGLVAPAHSPTPVPPAEKPGLLARLAALGKAALAKGRNALGKMAGAMKRLRQALVARTRSACKKTVSFVRAFWLRTIFVGMLAKKYHKPLLIAGGTGLVVGLGCYYAGPAIASTVSGLYAFAGSLMGRAWQKLRQAMALPQAG